MEARRSQCAFKTVAPKSTSDPMDVDSFGKKGKGEQERPDRRQRSKSDSESESKQGRFVCWHCGERGHMSTECWSNPMNQSGPGGIQNKGGKGKQRNGTGKGTGSLEQGEQAAVVEPQQPALASSLDLASFETLVRSPHLGPEVG